MAIASVSPTCNQNRTLYIRRAFDSLHASTQAVFESDSFEDMRIHETITFKSLDKLLSKYLSDAIQSQ